MIIAVPNQDLINSIPLDSTHVHAFTSESLKNIIEKLGFKQELSLDAKNGISFISKFKKISEDEVHWISTERDHITCSE